MGIVYSEPICQAAYDDDLHRVYLLLSEDEKTLNAQDSHYGDTAIIAACRRGNTRVVKYLLDHNTDVSLRNKKNRTCLHYAARRTFSLQDYLMIAILMPVLLIGYLILVQKQRKNVRLMGQVLSSAVEVDAVDYKGNTALHYACQRKNRDLVPLLLEKKADVSILNHLLESFFTFLASGWNVHVLTNKETPLDIARRLGFKKIVSMLKKSD